MKGQSNEEKLRILAIAGNPHNGLVEPLNSIEGGFRILQRKYFYNKKTKRGDGTKKSIGVVIDNKYYTNEEYHNLYTHRGNKRLLIPVVNKTNTFEQKQPSVELMSFDNSESNKIYQRIAGPIPILYAIAKKIGIVVDLVEAYGKEITDQIISLAFHWITDSDNVAKRFPRFCKSFALPFTGVTDDSQLSQFYAAIGNDTISLSKLFSLRTQRVGKGARLNYDSTSIPTSASDIYYSEVSLTKDDTFGPMEHFTLLVDQKTHMPIMYEVYSGKMPDCLEFDDILEKSSELSDFASSMELVLDRGYETRNNWLLAAKGDRKCLMASRSMKYKVVIDAIDSFSDFWDASSVIPGTTIHGHTVQKTINYRGVDIKLWIHIYRDDAMTANQKAIFFNKLDKFEKLWHDSSIEKRAELCENEKLMSLYDYADLKQDLKRNDSAINTATRYFGFFANISNYELTAKESLEIYKRRDSIEKCFKSGKMNLKMNTERAHKQDTMQGRFVVAFVALCILSELQNQLSIERIPEDTRKKIIPANKYSIRDIIEITRGITINYTVSNKKIWFSGVLKEVQSLSIACGTPAVYEQPAEYVANPRDLRPM